MNTYSVTWIDAVGKIHTDILSSDECRDWIINYGMYTIQSIILIKTAE